MRTNNIWTHIRAPQFNKKAVKALALESQKYIQWRHDWECLWTADISAHSVGTVPQVYSEVVLLPWNWHFHPLPLQQGPGLFLLTIKIIYHQQYLLFDICFYNNLRTNLEFYSETTYSQAVLYQILLGLMPAGSISEAAGKKSHQRTCYTNHLGWQWWLCLRKWKVTIQ